jgi:GNAT superfamily N-acetyltransferase
MQALAPTAIVRRASLLDTDGVLALTTRFVQRSPHAQFVCYDPEVAREALLGMLDRGAVFVLESGERILGAIAGVLSPLWFSRDVVAVELGWWVDADARGHGEQLRREFEHWAREQGAEAVCMSDVVLDDATPAGTLYERAGYAMVERSWIKGIC